MIEKIKRWFINKFCIHEKFLPLENKHLVALKCLKCDKIYAMEKIRK